MIHDVGNRWSMIARAADMFFGTKEAWLDIVRAWARKVPEVHQVWIFGARATGVRRAKEDRAKEPDLDIAYTMRGSDFGSLLGLSIIDGKKWQASLGRQLPVCVDLQFTAPDDEIVWPAVLEHGRLVYYAED